MNEPELETWRVLYCDVRIGSYHQLPETEIQVFVFATITRPGQWTEGRGAFPSGHGLDTLRTAAFLKRP